MLFSIHHLGCCFITLCLTLRWSVDALNLRIQPLGDSITFGVGSSTGNGYRQDLLDLLNGNQVDLIGSQRSGTMVDKDNEGHSGAIITQIANFATLSLPQRPNVVLLHAGTNDMNIPSQPDTAPQRLSALIDQILAACPDATVVVAQIIVAANANTNARRLVYNQAVASIVQQKKAAGAHVLSVDMPLTTADLADGLHPSDAGFVKMAQAWYKGISQANSFGWIHAPVTGKPAICSHGPTWSAQGTVASGVGCLQSQVRFADLNGDGKADYLFVHPDGSVEAWQNLGGPDAGPNAAKVSWAAQGQIFNSPTPGSTTVGPRVTFADINGDGRADYLLVNDDSSVEAWLNLGNPNKGAQVSWQPQGVIATGIGEDGAGVHFADLSGKGLADYLWVNLTNGAVSAWLNTGSSDPANPLHINWMSQGIIASGIGRTRTGVTFADMNGDGRAEYLWVDQTNGAVSEWQNLGGPDMGAHADQVSWFGVGQIASGIGSDGVGVRFADLSGDGMAEYLNVGLDSSVVAYLNVC